MRVNINNVKVLNELQKKLNINDDVLSYICAMSNKNIEIVASKDLLRSIVIDEVASEDLVIYDIDGIGTVLNTIKDPYVWDAQYLSKGGYKDKYTFVSDEKDNKFSKDPKIIVFYRNITIDDLF